MSLGQIFASWITRFSDTNRGYRSQNAMTPIIWYSSMGSAVLLGGAYYLRENPLLNTVLGLAGLVPIGIAGLIALWFALRDPDRLHTEDFRLRSQAVELLQEKGGRLRVEPIEMGDILEGGQSPRMLGPAAANTAEEEVPDAEVTEGGNG